MSVTIILPGSLQVFTENKDTVEVEGTTVGECLKNLVKSAPAIENVLFFSKNELFNFGYNKVSIFVNGVDTYPEELTTSIRDGDTLHILFTIGGG